MQVVQDNSAELIKQYAETLVLLEKNAYSTMHPDEYSKLINKVLAKINQVLDNAKGKKLVIDIAELPKEQGLTLDDWLHYFENAGVAVIDTRPKYTAPKQSEFIITSHYKLTNGKYIIPNDTKIPSKYWGMVAENKIIRWYEE